MFIADLFNTFNLMCISVVFWLSSFLSLKYLFQDTILFADTIEVNVCKS